MESKLTKGKSSNYEVNLKIDETELSKFKDKVLKNFQKDFDMPGFRKGHVPLNIVEQNIHAQYLQMGIYEEAIYKGLDKVIEENSNIKFIGQIYDLQQNVNKNGILEVSFKIDYYPEVEVKNQNWKTIKLNAIDDNVSESEIQEGSKNLKSQYAEFKDSTTINEDTVSKIKFEYLDKEGNVVDKGTTMIGKEDFDEYKKLKELFLGKTKGEKFENKYTKKDLPEILHCKKEDLKPASIRFDIVDVKDKILPNWDEATLTKLFGGELKSENELNEKIKEIIQRQKYEAGLTKEIESLIQQSKESLEICMPHTLIEEENKTRIQSLQKRFGGEKGLQEYINRLGEEKGKEMMEQIKTASKESLEKYFIFRKLVELLEINDIDWNSPLDAEKKVFDAITGTETETETTTKTKKTKDTAKKTNKK